MPLLSIVTQADIEVPKTHLKNDRTPSTMTLVTNENAKDNYNCGSMGSVKNRLLHARNVVVSTPVKLRGLQPKKKTSPQLRAESLKSSVQNVTSYNVTSMELEKIYCSGPLLHAIQTAEIYRDSKQFVDMALRQEFTVDMILDNFNQLLTNAKAGNGGNASASLSRQQLEEFVHKHFLNAGNDLIPAVPMDFKDEAQLQQIPSITDQELRQWAMGLHELWKSLGRLPNVNVRSSFLRVPPVHNEKALERNYNNENLLILPGGRFLESYYWDSYWIVEGLLVSEMFTTARGVVNNLLEYASYLGFVPNGGRIYYLSRSQPPMLSDMVRLVARKPQGADIEIEWDLDYLKAALPILVKEYSFWMHTKPHFNEVTQQTYAPHAVEIEKDGKMYILNRYVANANAPRPESYSEDYEMAERIFGSHEAEPIEVNTDNMANTTKNRFYNDIIAAAESGWDFSSRWFRNRSTLDTVYTESIVPVDLNAILYRVELNLSQFHRVLGNVNESAMYEALAQSRLAAINAILWNEQLHCWKDYDMETKGPVSITEYAASDYFPLWARAYDMTDVVCKQQILESLRDRSTLIQIGGVRMTTIKTDEQWDSPNAWPPVQDIIVDGLLGLDIPEGTELAKVIVHRWVTNGLMAWRNSGVMFEKYSATHIGETGDGGEYEPQTGFGWSNGVILKFLTAHQSLYRSS
uniref:Trehalase n=1 Tax=Albugo laibachii Nc14 TaxID=890382 RepID=F0W9A7_9STRA|nr:unnamed protein product [Albugo laibachii Nc14]CCA18366.1 unnamed protein product [Albugo laibachii Nc14]|eukprot:CCA18366.1 unnamed protein product [Albugo laibachii Nc14]